MGDILSKFASVWEVESHFRCTVVGAMLSVEKHKNILKKCGYNVKALKPYEYHQQIMAKLNEENNVSIKVNNFIRSKARKYMIKIANMTDSRVMALWKEHLETGDVGPLFYAIVSYKETCIEVLQDVYGQIHMLAHANMTGVFDVKKQLAQADKNLLREKEKTANKNQSIKKMVQTRNSDIQKIIKLETENYQIKKKVYELESRLEPGESIRIQDKTIHALEQHIAELGQDMEQSQGRTRILEREKKALQIDLFSSNSENKLLKKVFHSLINGYKPCASTSCPESRSCIGDSCPQYQLCAKKVFMVGGITKMRSFYKEIVENAGGEFDYHDGYMKNTNTNFAAKVRRCDVVLCPVNCNSHSACLKVKKLCKQYNKECKILSSSSLSAVSQALLVQLDKNLIN